MNARLALILTGALTVLILIPVLAVVGLELYGSALDGSTRVTGASGAELTLQPVRGPSGSIVKISAASGNALENAVVSLMDGYGQRLERAVTIALRETACVFSTRQAVRFLLKA
ncbi:MAG: hypothetical protein OXG46_06170 [Chloroflexi bacterium]|nr:hypothetical protein [Chloroflexota bacterium]